MDDGRARAGGRRDASAPCLGRAPPAAPRWPGCAACARRSARCPCRPGSGAPPLRRRAPLAAAGLGLALAAGLVLMLRGGPRSADQGHRPRAHHVRPARGRGAPRRAGRERRPGRRGALRGEHADAGLRRRAQPRPGGEGVGLLPRRVRGRRRSPGGAEVPLPLGTRLDATTGEERLLGLFCTSAGGARADPAGAPAGPRTPRRFPPTARGSGGASSSADRARAAPSHRRAGGGGAVRGGGGQQPRSAHRRAAPLRGDGRGAGGLGAPGGRRRASGEHRPAPGQGRGHGAPGAHRGERAGAHRRPLDGAPGLLLGPRRRRGAAPRWLAASSSPSWSSWCAGRPRHSGCWCSTPAAPGR